MALNPITFADYFKTTRESFVGSYDDLIYVAERNKTPFFDMIRGLDEPNLIQDGNGTEIIESVLLGVPATFGTYRAGSTRTINTFNGMTQIGFKRRTMESNYGWTDEEFETSTNGGDVVKVKSFEAVKDKKTKQDHIQGLDDTMFAQPNATEMELAVDKGLVYSVPCFITEDDPAIQRIPPGWATAGGTTLGRMPASETRSANVVSYYDHTKFDDPDAGFLAAFDDMELTVVFDPPNAEGDDRKATDDTMFVIYTNKDGMKRYKSACRKNNDRLASLTDLSVGRIKFGPWLIVHAPQLDRSLLAQSRATAGVASVYRNAPFTTGRPRYYCWDKRYMNFKFMSGKMMKLDDVIRGKLEVPDVTVAYTRSWGNLVCRSRSRLAVIAPAAGD